jgi:hypothetical protein
LRAVATGRTITEWAIAARTFGALLAIERPGARTLVTLGARPTVTSGTIATWTITERTIATGLVTIRTITTGLVAIRAVTARLVTEWPVATRTFRACFALE